MEPKTCHHCGNEWEPRKANPKKCPRCMNPLWKSPRPKKIKLDGVAAQPSARASLVESGGVVFDSLTPAYREAAPSDPEPECMRAPEEKDSLSQMKQRAESLLSKLI